MLFILVINFLKIIIEGIDLKNYGIIPSLFKVAKNFRLNYGMMFASLVLRRILNFKAFNFI
jgi:hypothetical protein